MRKKIIAGNWKMNRPEGGAMAFAKELAKSAPKDVDIVFCVPFVGIMPVAEAVGDSGVCVGGQNLHTEAAGAYTGEISGEMLAAAGAKYVLVGHSERRQYFGETDIIVNQKAQRALQSGLLPIICIGETLTQREQGITIDLLRMQTKIALQGISEAEAAACVIAYEPVWAIGTGVVATAEQAEEACAAVRQVLREIYNDQTAEKIRIQYGGSVTPKNAAELFAMPNIDGGLVGGASLKPDFAEIMNS